MPTVRLPEVVGGEWDAKLSLRRDPKCTTFYYFRLAIIRSPTLFKNYTHLPEHYTTPSRIAYRTSLRKPSNMGLLDLPAELRNTIYELSLPNKVAVTVSGKTRTAPAVLRTNRQIRYEAMSAWQPVFVYAEIEDNQMDGPILWLADRAPAANKAIVFLEMRLTAGEDLVNQAVKVNEHWVRRSKIQSNRPPETLTDFCNRSEERIEAACIDLRSNLKSILIEESGISFVPMLVEVKDTVKYRIEGFLEAICERLAWMGHEEESEDD